MPFPINSLRCRRSPSLSFTTYRLASWLGLVPSQNSTRGKTGLGRIAKAGDRSLRTLPVIGATGAIRYANRKVPGGSDWLIKLLAKKGKARLATVALPNKMARIVWALLKNARTYQAPAVPTAA